MQPDYDDLDDLEEGGFNWMLAVVLLLAVAGFFSLAWYAYQTGSQQTDNGEVVVIKADPSPVKEKPKDPGGMTFPHQEKTIYDALNSKKKDGSVEISILPNAEEPDMNAVDNEPAAEPADKKVADIIQRAVEDMQKQNREPKVVEPAPEPVTPPKPEATPKPVVQPKAEPAPVAATGERIQLGAFRSNVEAEKQWEKILRGNKDVLGGKPHQVVRADLGAKGVFYRLRVAGFNSEADAKSACKALSGRGQGCFVVR